MAYIDTNELFKCETCRRYKGDKCLAWCENGECYSPNMKKIPTANVAPKSEVVKVLDDIEKTIRGASVLVGFSYKHNPKEIQCKKECYEDFLGYIAELKKKYTEGENEES